MGWGGGGVGEGPGDSDDRKRSPIRVVFFFPGTYVHNILRGTKQKAVCVSDFSPRSGEITRTYAYSLTRPSGQGGPHTRP